MTSPMHSRPHTVYKMYDEHDMLLYIGMTADLDKRLSQHRADKDWYECVALITVDHYPNRAEAATAELKAIALERPLLNVAGSPKQATLFDDDGDYEDALESLLGNKRTGNALEDALEAYREYTRRQARIIEDLALLTEMLRTRFGVSIRDIEEATGIPKSTISRWTQLAKRSRAKQAA